MLQIKTLKRAAPAVCTLHGAYIQTSVSVLCGPKRPRPEGASGRSASCRALARSENNSKRGFKPGTEALRQYLHIAVTAVATVHSGKSLQLCGRSVTSSAGHAIFQLCGRPVSTTVSRSVRRSASNDSTPLKQTLLKHDLEKST